MSKLTHAQEQILQALRSNQAETVNIGLSPASAVSLTEEEILKVANANKPVLKISHTARVKGDLLRKKQAAAAAEAAKKGW